MPEYPPIVDKWNWGAFSLSWIWGIFNGLYWPLIIIALNFIPYIGFIFSLYICIKLGIRGNKLAWRLAKQNAVSENDFVCIQKRWNYAGLSFIIIFVICATTFLTFFFL